MSCGPNTPPCWSRIVGWPPPQPTLSITQRTSAGVDLNTIPSPRLSAQNDLPVGVLNRIAFSCLRVPSCAWKNGAPVNSSDVMRRRNSFGGSWLPGHRQIGNAARADDLPEVRVDHVGLRLLPVGQVAVVGIVQDVGRAAERLRPVEQRRGGERRDVDHVAEREDRVAARVIGRAGARRGGAVELAEALVVLLVPLAGEVVGQVAQQLTAGVEPGSLAVRRVLAGGAGRARPFRRLQRGSVLVVGAAGVPLAEPDDRRGQVLRVGNEAQVDRAIRGGRAAAERRRAGASGEGQRAHLSRSPPSSRSSRRSPRE